MSDGDRLRDACRNRRWGLIAGIVAANVVMASALAGMALLALLVGIYALDWLGVLPCICV